MTGVQRTMYGAQGWVAGIASRRRVLLSRGRLVTVEALGTLAKTVLFYFYFMAILILSHLFLYYFILTKLYFISILPDKENRASILFEFYFYFNPILKQD